MADGPAVTAALKLRDEMSRPLEQAADRAKSSFGGMGGAAFALVGAAAAAGAGLIAFGVAAVVKTTEAGQAAYQMGEKFGLAGDQASAWLTVARHLGVNSDSLGAGFKFLAKNVEGLNLQFESTGKVGKGTAQVFKDIGINVFDAQGHMKSANELMLESADVFARMPDGIEKTGLALKLFGKQGMEMLPVLNQGRAGLEALMKAGKLTGEVMSKDQVEAAHKLFLAQQKLNSELTGFTTIVGTALMPIAADFMGWVVGTAIPGLVAFARPIVDDIVPAFRSLITAGLPPLRTLFGYLQQGVGFVTTLGRSFQQFNEHLSGTATLGDRVSGAVGSFADAFGQAPETVDSLGAALAGIVDTVQTGALPILDDLRGIWQDSLAPALAQVRERMIALEPRFVTMLEKIRPVFGVMMQLTHIALQGLAWVLKVLLPPAIDLVVSLFGLIFDTVGNLAGVFMDLWGLLDDLFHGRWGKLWGDVQKLFADLVMTVLHLVAGLVVGIGQFFGRLIDNIVGSKGSIPMMVGRLVQWFKDLPGKIAAAILGIDRWLYQKGIDLIQGLWNGITQKWRDMLNDFGKLAAQLPEPIKKILGISSPSRVMMEVGRNYVAGLQQGVLGSWPGLQAAVGRLGFARPALPGVGAAGLGSGATAAFLAAQAGSGGGSPDLARTNALLARLVAVAEASPRGQSAVAAALYRAFSGAQMNRNRGMAGA